MSRAVFPSGQWRTAERALQLARQEPDQLLQLPLLQQLETGEKEPALKAVRLLAPVLDVTIEELAFMAAGGTWAGASFGSDAFTSAPRTMTAFASAPPPGRASAPSSPERLRDKTLLSLERRLRDLPPLERIGLLNELITQALAELGEQP